MAHGAAAFSREELLAHREWVRALAVSLTSTRDDADEVEQETWLAAISAPPPSRHSVGGWLAVVARHAAMKLRRKRSRVRRREDAAPAPAAPESPDRLVARTEAHAVVVAAVLALAEPYRTTVLLRFFEGLPVRDVASRSEVPLETARARLRRAKALLRNALDAKFGGERRRGALMVLAAARPPGKVGVAAGAAGGALMTAKMVAAALVVVAVAGTGVWRATRSPAPATPQQQSPDAAPAPTVSRVGEPRARSRVAPPASESTAAAAPGEAPQAVEQEAPKSLAERLDAKVTDVQFDELSLEAALARISARTGIPIAISAGSQDAARKNSLTCHFDDVPARTLLHVMAGIQGLGTEVDGDRVVLFPTGKTKDAAGPFVPIEPVVDVPRPLRGVVTDESGVPIADAEIVAKPRSTEVLARTDAAGRFQIEVMSPRPTLAARVPGRVASMAVTLPADWPAEKEVRLRVRGPAASLRVRVEDEAAGTPLAGAGIWCQRVTATAPRVLTPEGLAAADETGVHATTDDRGIAAFDSLQPGEVAVTAQLEGREKRTARVTAVAGSPAEVTLKLRTSVPVDERLAQEVSFDFTDARLGDVTAYLSELSGVAVVPHSALGVDVFVTLRVDRLPLRDVLDRICAAAGEGVRWETKGRIVSIRRDP